MYSVFMSLDNSFKIISVTGAHSKVGKTTLASILLNNLEGFGAIKYTKTSFYTSVTDDTDTILQKDKDTAILSESGAERVVWIQSPVTGLKDALNIAVSKMENLEGVIVEGNSPVDFLNPDLVIFIIGEEGTIKPSAKKVSSRADIIILNSPKNLQSPPFLAAMVKQKTKVFQIDLMTKTGDIETFMACMKKLLKSPCNNITYH